MTRIAIIDRADRNAEQARVYDAAKQTRRSSEAPILLRCTLMAQSDISGQVRDVRSRG